MNEDEFTKEHDRLISVLKSPSHSDDKKEAKKQKKEVKEELGKEERTRIDREIDGKQEFDFGTEELEKDKGIVSNNQDAQNDYDVLMRFRNKKKKTSYNSKKIVEDLDKDESKGGVSNNQDSNNDRDVLDKWRKLKKAIADDAFMSIAEEAQQPDESEPSPENQQQSEQPEEAQQSDQSGSSDNSNQQAPQEDMSDEEMQGILAQARQGDEGQSNTDTESNSDQQAEEQAQLKENEVPQEEESDQSVPDTESEQPSEESLEELMSQLGYSDAEIAHVIHGHHFPDVDELQDAKADTERAKKEGELSLQELEMKIKQGEHELKSGGAEKLTALDVDHKSKMQELEVEHMKRIKELEYEKAKRKAQAEDDLDHKCRMRNIEYDRALRDAQANDEVHHKGKMREVEHTKALKDIPGDRFDDTEHQKRMMDLEYEKAKREMELDLQIKKQQSEHKMKQMEIDAQVRQKEKAQAVKDNAQAKKEEPVKKNLLEKGYKENILAGAMALSPMSIPEQQAPKTPIVSAPIVDKATQVKNVFNNVNKRNPILGAIGAHESTKGERWNKHRMVTVPGMNYGHTAGGTFAMMPVDVAELINKNKNLATKYPDMVGLTKDVKANHKHITAQINDNPEMAADLAEAKLNHNKSKNLTDDELIHSWYHGLTGTLNARKAGHNLSHNNYVKAVKSNLPQGRAPANKENK